MKLRAKNNNEKLFQIIKLGKFSETNCFEWIGSKDKNGYGIHVFKATDNKGKTWKVHRLIWHLLNGKIPEKMLICHACDNPCCFNINHLYIGTSKDNSQDREKKGRGKVRKIGEDNPQAILTECLVLLIRKKYQEGIRVCDLVREFNIKQPTISKIIHRKRWQHLPNDG